MAAVIVVVVLVLAGAGVAFLVRQRGQSPGHAGRGPNEILRSPPSSFPSALPGSLTPLITPVPPGTALPAMAPPNALRPVPIDDAPEVARDDAAILERFRAPDAGAEPGPTITAPVVVPRYPLEPVASQPEPEPEPAVAEAVVPTASSLALVDDDEVIDLDADPVVAEEERAWQQVLLEPEPDSVDHVLQALINRARFKQVGVEEVATELVERADLRGEQVSDVLAELVGRADDQAIDPDRASELVLFNDAVPSRPGQLTDFARLNPVDKKRIIIRVLCLLVARSEDQQLPPRATGESPTTSWPLARASWPVSLTDEEGDVSLPSRLAKSG